MGQEQSNTCAQVASEGDTKGGTAASPQQHKRQTSVREATSIPTTTAPVSSSVSIPAQVVPVPAVVIAARLIEPPQPYLPHSLATIMYLDTLLSKAEAASDVHRHNIALVAERLKTMQEQARERMEQETKASVEKQQQQTEMRDADDDDAGGNEISEHFAKRARQQLMEETQSLYGESVAEADESVYSFHHHVSPQQGNSNMLSQDLLEIMNPLALYADPESNNELNNDTGLIGAPTRQDEDNAMLNLDTISKLEESESLLSPSPPFTGNSSLEPQASSPPDSTSVSDNSAVKSPLTSDVSKWCKCECGTQLRRISSKFKANFQRINALAVLERAHRSGLIPLDLLVQYLGFMQLMMEQEDHDSLINQFNAMSLQQQLKENETSSDAVIPTPTSISLASQMLPVYVDDLIPDVCASDDQDGVARIRILMRYATSGHETYQELQIEKKKRRRGGGELQEKFHEVKDDLSITVPSSVVSSSSPASTPSSCSSSSSSSVSTPIISNPVVYRIAWFNSSFERTFGYTQQQQKEEFAWMGGRIIFKFVRSDHIAAFHYLLTKMKFEGKNELHMYQVRMTKDGREIYCLVHVRINSVRGKMMDSCQSIIPLPEEAQKDMPPFQEGVDLDEETLLYGYRRQI